MELDRLQALCHHVRRGSSIARAASSVGLAPELAYRLHGEDGRALRESVRYRNQHYGIGWTDEFYATGVSDLAPDTKRKRQVLNIARSKRRKAAKVAGFQKST